MMIYSSREENAERSSVFWLAQAGIAGDADKDTLEKAIYWLSQSGKDSEYVSNKDVKKWLADSYYALGNWQKALSAFKELGGDDYRLTQCYIEQERYDEALKLTLDLIDKNKNDEVAWYLYTLTLYLSGDDTFNYFKGTCTASFPTPQKGTLKLLTKKCRICSWVTLKNRRRGGGTWTFCLNPDCPSKKRENKT